MCKLASYRSQSFCSDIETVEKFSCVWVLDDNMSTEDIYAIMRNALTMDSNLGFRVLSLPLARDKAIMKE